MSKISFKIYRKDLKVIGEGFVMFKSEVQSLRVEEVIVMTACLKSYHVYSILLENLNIPIQSDLTMCFN